MDGTESATWFLGDLHDPWVSALLNRISTLPRLRAVMCDGDLPERLSSPDETPDLVILHRSRLWHTDLRRLDEWRSQARPRIIVCFSPYVRYSELERCERLVDLLIAEGTAHETLDRHLRQFLNHPATDPRVSRASAPRVDVVSTNHALREALVEGLSAQGFRARPVRDGGPDQALRAETADRPVVTVWDVPILEPGWTKEIEHRRGSGPVVALMGFADRALVTQARAAGAAACLDLPLDLDDLAHVLDRVSSSLADGGDLGVEFRRPEPAHAVPPPPAWRGNRGRAAILDRRPRLVAWPGEPPSPTIPTDPAA